jgi:hypothetical protein
MEKFLPALPILSSPRFSNIKDWMRGDGVPGSEDIVPSVGIDVMTGNMETSSTSTVLTQQETTREPIPPSTPPGIVLTGASDSLSPLDNEILRQVSPAPSSAGITVVGEGSAVCSVKDENETEECFQEDRDAIKAEVFAELDKLIGLGQVKEQFRDIEKRIEAYQKQGVNLNRERFHVKFLGNPGTGPVIPIPRRWWWCGN